MIAVLSPGIRQIPCLENFLDDRIRYVRFPFITRPADCSAVVGWGRKASANKALKFSVKHGLPYIALEDGFLRSVELGVSGKPPLSMVYDDMGIYYDASHPSRLEHLIATGIQSQSLLDDARNAIALIRQYRLSKYNHAPDVTALDLPPPVKGKVILVVDQTLNDMSVCYGGADKETFKAMLKSAQEENPGASIWIKTHPDVLAGKRKAYLDDYLNDANLIFIQKDVNPLSLLEKADKVYVVTSQMGFEALLLKKPVICFGQPWYAAWGLTDDRHPGIHILKQRRFKQRTVEQLFAAAYFQYARYIQPENRKRGSVLDIIEYLINAKRFNDQTRGELHCIGMSLWKRAVVTPFLKGPVSQLRFVRSLKKLRYESLPENAKLIFWGNAQDKILKEFSDSRQMKIFRMEDGFLRSVGLGSDLRRPLSLVLDDRGIYYDSRTESALEHWLENGRPNKEMLERARRLRERLIQLRLSKYNVGPDFTLSPAAKNKLVILVPGQIEEDASIQYGSPEIRTNLALLQTVRGAHPDAFIVFKPHPDLVAKNRPGAVLFPQLEMLCDQVVIDANIIDCIQKVDAVHTMTSLSGFEALLHGKQVYCYGLPFYAGWGLTCDRLPVSRRTRNLTLDELVYGALIYYPRYIRPDTLTLTSPESVVEILEQDYLKNKAYARNNPITKQWRKLVELSKVLILRRGYEQ